MAKTKLIIGLGNVGEEYERTRHNVGFAFVDMLAKKAEAEFAFEKKFNADVATGKLEKIKVVLAKPHTFVNKSGESVKKLKLANKAKLEDIVIVHDDLDIEFGRCKMSLGKDSGGHRGVQSVLDHLKSNVFWRLRIGTASRKLTAARNESNLKDKKEGVVNFVLSKFTPTERDELKKVLKEALEKLYASI